MRFIGQFIQNLISRFRNDVYLEDISSGTIASGGNLGLDSNNKIVKANVPADGDIDRVRISTSSGNAEVTSGNADFTLSGSTPIGVTNSGTTITIAANDASTSAKGVASFSSANFSVSSGSVTIKSGGVDLTDEVTGVLPVANTAAKVTSIVAGDGIDVSGATGDVTVTAETATDSNPGVVELATTGEADTGTDTARAVTPAGLKSHVDARYHYQYISFSFSVSMTADSWHTPSQHGIDNHSWTNTHKVGGTQVASDNPPDVDGSTTISIDYLDQPSCIVIPKACKLVGFYGNSRLHSLSPDNDARPVFGLFRAAEPSDRNNADVTATVVAFDSYDTTAAGNNMLNRFLKLNADVDVDLAAGDLIYPAFGVDKTGITGSGYGSFTVVLKTLIP